MGIQDVGKVDLIQGTPTCCPSQPGARASGARCSRGSRPTRRGRLLVGTWAAAEWAIRFYERHGFELASRRSATAELLRTYWDIPERQIETSVVLAKPPLG